MRGSRLIWLASFALALLCGASHSSFAAVASAPQAGDYLGFDIGEERHYVLGPPDALQPRESAKWTIRLDRVDDEGGGRRLVFTLSHTREAPRSLSNQPVSGAITIATVEAELTVNSYGSPLELSYTSLRHIYDLGDEEFEVTYRHDHNKYQKEVFVQGVDWDFAVPLIEHPNLDPLVPLGIFAYTPDAVECLEWLVGITADRRIGTLDNSPRDAGVTRVAYDGDAAVDLSPLALCNERNTDPAFANPGLLSLVLPTLWEERGDSELVLLSPLRPDLARSDDTPVPITFGVIVPGVPTRGGIGGILGGLSTIALPTFDMNALLGRGGAEGDKSRAGDPGRYYQTSRMRLAERQRMRIGTRMVDALPLHMSGYGGTAYVDDWGKVVRVDLPRAAADPQRWIRLLHLSEY